MNPPTNPPKPITATLMTLCGCKKEISMKILWPDYRVPLEVQSLTNMDMRYELQPKANEVNRRVFKFINCKMSSEGTHALYKEIETLPPSK